VSEPAVVRVDDERPALPDSPYVGLTHYTEEDAQFFFGRESERKVIAANLMASRLTVLYAESGVGKSSLLRAGVASHLNDLAAQTQAERGKVDFFVAVFSSWADDPVAGVTKAIADAAAPFVGGEPLEAADGLAETIETSTKRLEARALVVLDQFEEYFLYHPHDEGEGTFAHEFVRAVNRRDLPVSFLIAIREDALAQLDRFKGEIPGLFDNYVRIDRLDEQAARAAIKRPLDQYNRLLEEAFADRGDAREPVGIEDALVDEVLDQVQAAKMDRLGGREAPKDGDASVPVATKQGIETTSLQLVMERLWEEERKAGSPILRLETLRRLGGAEEIISSHLDATMDALTDDQRKVAARVFHHLVTPGGQKLAQTVRDLAIYAETPEGEVLPVLGKLASDRILRSDAVPAGQGDGFRYVIAHDVLGKTILDWRADYVATERQRATERQLAEQRRRVRVLRLIAATCFGLLIVSGVAFAFALVARNDADEQKRTAQDRARRAESVLIANQAWGLNDPNAALLASVEAYRLWPTLDARSTILEIAQLNAGLPRMLVGHTRAVNGVAFSPDSQILASAGSDEGIVRLWDVATGKVLGEPLRGHANVVTAVAWRPRGRMLASASRDGTVKLWNASDPSRAVALGTLRRHVGWVNAVAFGGGGDLIASGDDSGAVTVRDVRDPAHPRRLPNPSGRDHAGAVLGLAFSPNRAMLASGGADGTVLLWRVSRSGGLAPLGRPLERRGGDVRSLAFSPAEDMLAAGRENGSVTLWDLSEVNRPRFRRSLDGHTEAVSGVAFNDDGSVLVTGGDDDTVVSWNLRMNPPQPFGPPRTHGDDVTAVTVSPDGKLIASAALSANLDTALKLWSLERDEALAATLGTRSGALNARLGDDGDLAVASDLDNRTQIWNLRGLRLDSGLLRSPRAPRPSAFVRPRDTDGFTVARRGDLLAASNGTEFTLWNMRDPSDPRKYENTPITPHIENVEVLTLSVDGEILASGSDDATVLWDVSNPERPDDFASVPEAGDVNAIAFSPSGSVLALANEAGDVHLWDIENPARPRRFGSPWPLRGHGGAAIYALAFHPNGRVLASGGADQKTVLWNLARPTRVEPIGFPLPQTNSILAVAFSPDGKVLAAADGDSSAVLWDVPTQRSLGLDLRVNAFGEGASIDSVEFDDEGRFLVSAGRQNPIVLWSSVLWSADATTLRRYACQLARRNLTRSEWRAFFARTELAGKHRETCPPEWLRGP
jgi:WD40 repeat protein